MNSNEIVYERKMTGSFMKLRCDEVKPLDEKILLKNNIPGFLKMEKCCRHGLSGTRSSANTHKRGKSG